MGGRAKHRKIKARAGASADGNAGPKFRALLIGIDFYHPNRLPNGGTFLSLRGCVDDVSRVAETLRARVTIPLVMTQLLAPNVGSDVPGGAPESWPTYATIKAALDRLVAEAQPGDQVYIHYSGHGARVPTAFKDLKPGGYDETLVPMDIGKESTPHLRDIDIAHYLDTLAGKTQAPVTIVLDSCHSGGATRGSDVAPRCATGAREGTDPTLDTTARPAGGVAPADQLRASWIRLTAEGTGRRDVGTTTWLPEAKSYVLLAACRDVETALEAEIKEGRRGGVMTAAFLDGIEALDKEQTWQVLYERVLATVHSKFPSQTPQLLGLGERQILGTALRPVVRAVTVKQIDKPNRRVKIGAGLMTGTQKGSSFGIYKPGTTDFSKPENRVGAATIDTVGATESWATLAEGASIDAVAPGAPALLEDLGSIELRRAVNLVHRHDLPPGIDQDQALAAMKSAIETRGRGFLEVRAGGTPHYQVAVDEDRRYQIWDPQGKPMPNVGTVAVGAPGAADIVVDRLLHILRYQTILALDDSSSELKDRIGIELLAPPPGWSSEKPPQGGTVITPVGGKYVMDAGTWAFIHLVNRSSRPVNVAIVDLGASWGISAIHPAPPSGEAMPRGRYDTVSAGADLRVPIELYLPPERASSLDVLSIFATVDDTDFWWLLQPSIDTPVTRSITTRKEAANDALARLRDALDADRNTKRDVRPRSAPGEDWTVKQVRVVTRRT